MRAAVPKAAPLPRLTYVQSWAPVYNGPGILPHLGTALNGHPISRMPQKLAEDSLEMTLQLSFTLCLILLLPFPFSRFDSKTTS